MSTQKGNTTGPPLRRRRRVRLRLLLGMAVLIIGLPLVVLSVTTLSVTAPDWVRDRIETRLNARIGAGRVSLDQIRLIFDLRARPRVQMRNVGIFDARGAEIARLNEVRASFSTARLLQGVLAPSALTVSGAQITVRRRADGTFDLSLGTGAGTSGTLAGFLDMLDQAFVQTPLAELARITADQLTITLEDSRSGRIWQVTEGKMTLDQTADALDLTVSAEVFNGTEDLASTVIGIRIEKGSAKASLTATFENAAAADIAAQSPALAFLDVLDAPISGALHTTIDGSGRLQGFAGTLEAGSGALRPGGGARPIRFGGAQAYVVYDAETQSLEFTQVSLQSEAAQVSAEGTALLQDFKAGWPEELVGQFTLSDAVLQPANMFTEPMTFASGAVDFRLRLDPFSIDIGQVALIDQDRRYLGRGSVRAGEAGWTVSLDLSLNAIPLDRLLALWPVSVVPGTRKWLSNNVFSGQISDVMAAFRLAPGTEPLVSVNYLFQGAVIRALRSLPPIRDGSGYASLVGKTFTTVIEAGHIDAPLGGSVDMAGSVVSVADVTARPGRAELALKTTSSVTAALSLLDLPPFRLMAKSGLSPDLAEGRGDLKAAVGFDLNAKIEFADVDYTVTGRLTDVSSDVLVAGHTIRAADLALRADRSGVTISGPGLLGQLPANVAWSQAFGPDTAGISHVEGTVELGQAFLDEFAIGLPPGSVDGRGVAQVTVDLNRDRPPVFELVSDLNRLGLAIASLGWSKPRNQTGSLEVSGRLGRSPAIDRLALDAAGLRASGVVDLTPDGGLDTAQFDRVRLAGWLDGPVLLRGRGAGQAPIVVMSGGTIDMRKASLGNGHDGAGGSGPIELELDRLVVSEGIALTDFSGRFSNDAGLAGQFTARINGLTPVRGTLVPTPSGSAVGILSDDAGGAIAAAGILPNARGGKMDLTLNPTGTNGVYDGRLFVKGSRIVEAPALTELISALSIVGLLDQMNTGGISLNEVQAEFRLSPDRMTLYRSSAVGPSLGISLDGIYDLESGRMDMQGVISPVYFLNGIGQIFSRRGEGLFGFNFRLTGSSGDPNVSVNPLSILTPGLFREIFRSAPPEPASGQ